MAWVYLFLAGLFEIGWPWGYKIAANPDTKILGFSIAALCLVASGVLLFIAQKTIPMGTAYAIWTGIGAAGAFVVGVLFYQDPLSFWRTFGVSLIIGGVVILKLTAH